MGADNWTYCPKCKTEKEKKIAESEFALNKAYGKVPLAEYKEMELALNDLKNEESTKNYRELVTLREDYDIGIDGGVFSIEYRASCNKCDFRYKYEISEQV